MVRVPRVSVCAAALAVPDMAHEASLACSVSKPFPSDSGVLLLKFDVKRKKHVLPYMIDLTTAYPPSTTWKYTKLTSSHVVQCRVGSAPHDCALRASVNLSHLLRNKCSEKLRSVMICKEGNRAKKPTVIWTLKCAKELTSESMKSWGNTRKGCQCVMIFSCQSFAKANGIAPTYTHKHTVSAKRLPSRSDAFWTFLLNRPGHGSYKRISEIIAFCSASGDVFKFSSMESIFSSGCQRWFSKTETLNNNVFLTN